jgi:hypothetical protein
VGGHAKATYICQFLQTTELLSRLLILNENRIKRVKNYFSSFENKDPFPSVVLGYHLSQ